MSQPTTDGIFNFNQFNYENLNGGQPGDPLFIKNYESCECVPLEYYPSQPSQLGELGDSLWPG